MENKDIFAMIVIKHLLLQTILYFLALKKTYPYGKNISII